MVQEEIEKNNVKQSLHDLCKLNDIHHHKFRKIVNPIVSYLGAAGVYFDRFTFDGKLWGLDDNPELFRYYALVADGFKKDPFCKDASLIIDTMIGVWNDQDCSDKEVQTLNDGISQIFNISQGVNFHCFDENGFYGLSFTGLKNDVDFYNRLIRERRMVPNLIKYLLIELKSEISELEHNMFDVAAYVGERFYDKADTSNRANMEKRARFLIATNQLEEQDMFLLDVEMPRRERQCAVLYLKRYTMKQISDFLGISENSVNRYMLNLKSRLNVHRKGDLLTVLQKMEEMNYFVGQPFSSGSGVLE